MIIEADLHLASRRCKETRQLEPDTYPGRLVCHLTRLRGPACVDGLCDGRYGPGKRTS